MLVLFLMTLIKTSFFQSTHRENEMIEFDEDNKKEIRFKGKIIRQQYISARGRKKIVISFLTLKKCHLEEFEKILKKYHYEFITNLFNDCCSEMIKSSEIFPLSEILYVSFENDARDVLRNVKTIILYLDDKSYIILFVDENLKIMNSAKIYPPDPYCNIL